MATPVIIDIKANAQNAQVAIDKVNQGLNQTGDAAQNASSGADGASSKISSGFAKAAAKIYAAYAAIKAVIGGFFENQQAGVRLNAVLKATGGEAGITSAKMRELTKSLQDYTGQGVADVKSAQAVLLTFKKIGVDSFDRAQKAAADLSAVLQQDMKSSVLQLGKALEDPIRGITALRRAGVSFTEAEKKQIAQLQNSNRLYEAQAMVLKAIETQVGGTAKAMNDSDAGGFETSMNALKDALAKIGGLFAPVIRVVTKVIQGIADVIGWLADKAPAVLAGIGIAVAAAFGPVYAAIAAVIAIISLFSDSTASVEELTKSVSESKKVMDDLDKSQKTFNKTVEGSVAKLEVLKEGTAAYRKEVEALLAKYPSLIEKGISTSSSINDIRIAQAELNQQMRDKAILEAGKQYDKLKDQVADATTQLSRAQKAYEKDPSEANRAALNAAARMYQGLRREIERTGKLSGKTAQEMQDAMKQVSFEAVMNWDGNLKKMQTAIENTGKLIHLSWKETMSKMTDSEIQKEIDTLKIQRKARLDFQNHIDKMIGIQSKFSGQDANRYFTPTAGPGSNALTRDIDIKIAKSEAELRRRAAARAAAAASVSKGGGGKITDLSQKIEDTTFQNQIANLDKYAKKRSEIMYNLEKEELRLINDNSVKTQQRIDLVEQLRIKAANDIYKLEQKQQEELQKQIEKRLKEEEAQRKKLANEITNSLNIASGIVQTLSDGSKDVGEKLFDAGTQIAASMGPQGQAVAAALTLGKTLFKALKGNSESWAEKFEKRLDNILKTYKEELDKIDVISTVYGENDPDILLKKLNAASKVIEDTFGVAYDYLSDIKQTDIGKLTSQFAKLKPGALFSTEQMQAIPNFVASDEWIAGMLKKMGLDQASIQSILGEVSGMGATQLVNYLNQLKVITEDKFIEITNNLRNATIEYYSAIAKQSQTELEHREKMGEFADNENMYYMEKIDIYDEIIAVIQQELETNGQNYELQMQLWDLEEERYAAQQAINDAKKEEIGLTRKLLDMSGAQGFALHYRDRLAASLASSGITNPVLGTTPTVVTVEGGGGGTTNYYVNGISVASPSDAIMTLNDQLKYQTNTSLFG